MSAQTAAWLGHDSLSHQQRETESTHDPRQRQKNLFHQRILHK